MSASVVAFDVDRRTGAASNPRLFARYGPSDGIPDGSTVDADGYLWSSHWAGWRVTHYAPDGTIDRVIEMPVRTLTSCAFGGVHLGTLYVTSASIDCVDGHWVYMSDEDFERNPTVGGIFAIDADVRGLPETAFTG